MNENYRLLSDVAIFSELRTDIATVDSTNYISTENMLPNRGGVCEASTLPDVKKLPKYEPKDILLSNIRPYFKKIWYADKVGGCSNDVLVVKAKENIDPQFLYYVLSDNNFFNYSTVTSKGTKMPRGSKHAIMKYLVPNIDKPTQLKIVDILSTYDELIENNNKRIKLLEQMAENLYKEWFVRLRFPGYKNAEFENGIPKDWKYMKLNKVLTVFYGKDHSKLEDGDIPVYGSGGIMRYGNRALYEDESVLIPRKGSLNNIMWVNQPFWTVDTMFYTKALIPNVEKYIYYVLSSLDMASFNTGAALPSMTTDILYHLKIVVPSETLLARFDETVSELYKQRTLLEIKNNNLIKQRDLLLPRLMSGKLEV